MNITTRDWIMLIVLSVLWGGSYFFVEIALEGFPVLALVVARISLAAVALWGFVLLTRAEIPRSPKVWTAFLVMGVLNNIIPFSLIVWGQVEITSSLAAILTATTPIFAVIVAAVALPEERVTWSKGFAIILGFIGVVIMIGPDVVGEVGDAGLAQIAILGAAFSYSIASAFGKRFHEWGIKPVVSSTGQVTMSSLVLGSFVFSTQGVDAFMAADQNSWIAVILLAVLSTSVAYILYFRILASAGATNLMLVTFLIPVSAILLGVFVLGEQLRAIELIGMALIGLGMLIIDGRVLALISRPAGDR